MDTPSIISSLNITDSESTEQTDVHVDEQQLLLINLPEANNVQKCDESDTSNSNLNNLKPDLLTTQWPFTRCKLVINFQKSDDSGSDDQANPIKFEDGEENESKNNSISGGWGKEGNTFVYQEFVTSKETKRLSRIALINRARKRLHYRHLRRSKPPLNLIKSEPAAVEEIAPFHFQSAPDMSDNFEENNNAKNLPTAATPPPSSSLPPIPPPPPKQYKVVLCFKSEYENGKNEEAKISIIAGSWKWDGNSFQFFQCVASHFDKTAAAATEPKDPKSHEASLPESTSTAAMIISPNIDEASSKVTAAEQEQSVSPIQRLEISEEQEAPTSSSCQEDNKNIVENQTKLHVTSPTNSKCLTPQKATKLTRKSRKKSFKTLQIQSIRKSSRSPQKRPICFKTFSKTGKLQENNIRFHARPMPIHANKKPFQCSTCGKYFSYRHSLNQHQIIHTGRKPYKCLICLKRFNFRSNLTKHVLTIHKDKECAGPALSPEVEANNVSNRSQQRFKCVTCSKRYSRKDHFRRHELTHLLELEASTNQLQSPKHVNGNAKKQNRQIKTVQKRSHNQAKATSINCKFKCSDCPKTFNELRYLVIHQRTHTGERPFKCKVCDKRFSALSYLTQHLRIHSRPFKCSCLKPFTHKFLFRSHQKTCMKNKS